MAEVRVEILLTVEGGVTVNYSCDSVLARRLVDMAGPILALRDHLAMQAEIQKAQQARIISGNGVSLTPIPPRPDHG